MKISKKPLLTIILLFVVSLMLELFVFNYKHWISLGRTAISSDAMQLGASYSDNGDGTYTVIDGGDASIYFTGIHQELIASQIDITVLNSDGSVPDMVKVWQYVSDESNQYEYGLVPREVWADIPASSYMLYHLYGNCTGIRIVPNIGVGTVVSLNIALNPEIPLFFSVARMSILFGLMCFIYLFRPNSAIYRILYLSIAPVRRLALLTLLFAVHAGIFLFLCNLNPDFTVNLPEHHRQYQKLAEALKEGSFALSETPAASLQSLRNPYDCVVRDGAVAAQGEYYLWDTAYYEGHYYVYFGIVPVLLLYFPFYLITGTHIPNHIVILLSSLLFLVGLSGTLHGICKKWFPKLSLGIWLLSAELTLLGSGVIYLTKRPDLYNIPILMGLAFGLLGLTFFLRAEKDTGLSPANLFAGTLFTALTAGCRPQLLLFAVIPVILFRKQLFSAAFYRSSEGKKALLAVASPLLVVGGFLMYYNFSRFGSPFDFGANYNLTTNDMRHRGWVWARIPLGIFVYFLQPMRFSAEFPFAVTIFNDSEYLGQLIQEYTVGGVFATHIFALFAVLPFVLRKYLKGNHTTPYLLSIACLVISLVIAVADTEMAGILWRYQFDFSTFIMLAAVMTCWMIASHPKISGSSLRHLLIYALLICFASELFFQGTTFFIDTASALKDTRPDLFSQAKYLIAFWL